MADETWGRDNLELHCGICGTGNHALRLSAANPYLGNGTADSTPPRNLTGTGDISYWSRYWRALYRLGPKNDDDDDSSPPRLSGIGLRPTTTETGSNSRTTPIRVPRRADQGPDPYAHLHHRFSRRNSSEGGEEGEENQAKQWDLVHIRDVRPPPQSRVEADPEGMARVAWGFAFHESCWRLLGQACQPGAKGRTLIEGEAGEGDEEGSRQISSSLPSSALSAIDLGSLWRILNSVPCKSDLPNWGHNHGGLFLRSHVDGIGGAISGEWRRRFVLLERASVILVPSPYYDPFYVPELRGLLTPVVIPAESDIEGLQIEDGEQNLHMQTDEGKSSEQHAEGEPPAAVSESPPGTQEDEGNGMSEHAGTPAETKDPFAKLPFEIRQMLLTYIMSPIDVAHTRFASRAMAHVDLLSQAFFRSRFWPGRDLDFVFDGFVFGDKQLLLLQNHNSTSIIGSSSRSRTTTNDPSPPPSAVDWRNLYRQVRRRRRLNKFGLGEKNRMRVWYQTAEPLARALEEVGGLSELKGTRCPPPVVLDVEAKNMYSFEEEEEEEEGEEVGDKTADGGDNGDDNNDKDTWSTVSTIRYRNPERFGERGRKPLHVEVRWSSSSSSAGGGGGDSGGPSDDNQAQTPVLARIKVSKVKFFGETHITGLRFEFSSSSSDEVDVREIGYMALRKESWDTLELLPQEESTSSTPLLQGFYVMTNACGFRALALHAGSSSHGGHHMLSEYLDWAGDHPSGGGGGGEITMTTKPTLIRIPPPAGATRSGAGGGTAGARDYNYYPAVTRVRAAFDRFRLQALSISYR